ncbi:MAG: YceD family protein [Betaproteobacteria bacterium]
MDAADGGGNGTQGGGGGMSGRQAAAVRRDGTIDAWALSARSGAVEGEVDAAKLARVADRLAEQDVPGASAAVLTWRIAGIRDALGRPALDVAIDGEVPLECRRCLEPFAWPVSQRTMLLLAKDERELAKLDDDDEHEVVLASAPLDPLVLVEDELLLSLPFAPLCERPECTGAAPAMAAGRESAFGALEAWKPAPKRRK